MRETTTRLTGDDVTTMTSEKLTGGFPAAAGGRSRAGLSP
jgi:hypothetical protein